MIATLIEWGFWALTAYGLAGVLAAIPLHARGLAVIDRTVPGSGWKFRALITPGVIALWPLLLKRWLIDSGKTPEPDRWSGRLAPVRHRAMQGLLIPLLAVLIPIACGAGLLARGVAVGTAAAANDSHTAELTGE